MLVSRRCSGGDVHVACDMLMIYWYLMFDLKPFFFVPCRQETSEK